MTGFPQRGCLTDEDLALLDEGGATPSERDALTRHLGQCAVCRERWAVLAADEAPGGDALDASPIAAKAARLAGARPVIPWRRWAAAAGVLAAVGGTALLLRRGPEGRLEEGLRRIEGRSETFRTPPGTADAVELPDGSVVRIAGGTEARFLLPGEGERVRLELVRGRVEARVRRGGGRFVVESAAGRITVLGTRFTARAVRIHDAGQSVPVLSVEVEEGLVSLANGGKALQVPAGRRGILGPGGMALFQEAVPTDWRRASAELGSGASSAGFPSSSACATLLAAGWKGLSAWREALSDTGASSAERRLAALLTGLAAEGPDADSLASLYRQETDRAVREALRPHLARLVGPEAMEELDGKPDGKGAKE